MKHKAIKTLSVIVAIALGIFCDSKQINIIMSAIGVMFCIVLIYMFLGKKGVFKDMF